MKRIAPLLLLALVLPAAAAGPDAAVAYRQAVMKSVGGHMKAFGIVAKGEVARPEDLVKHATGLHDAATMVGALFPAGTGPDKVAKTGAKAEIWTKRAEFDAAVSAFERETAKLVEVSKASNLPAAQAQYDKVGETCGGCHDAFRVDD